MTLTAELTASEDSDNMPVLYPGLAEVYRRKVAELTDALSDDGRSAEAGEAMRVLLQEIRLVAEGDGLEIELIGASAGLLSLQKRKAPEMCSPGLALHLLFAAYDLPA